MLIFDPFLSGIFMEGFPFLTRKEMSSTPFDLLEQLPLSLCTYPFFILAF